MVKKLINPTLLLLAMTISVFIYGASQVVFAKNLIFTAILASVTQFLIVKKIPTFQQFILCLMTILSVVMLNFSSYSELLFEFELMFILSCLVMFYENAIIQRATQNSTLSRYVFVNLFVIAILMICSQFSNEEIFEQSTLLSLILMINFTIFPFSSWFCRIIENFSWHLISIFLIFIGKIFIFDLKMSFFVNVDHNLYWIGNFAIFTMAYSSIVAFFAVSNKKILAHLLVVKFVALSLIMLSKSEDSENFMAVGIYSQILFFTILGAFFQKSGKSIFDLGKLQLLKNPLMLLVAIIAIVQFCVFSIDSSFVNDVLLQDFAIHGNFIYCLIFIMILPYGRIILNLFNKATETVEPFGKIEKLYYLTIMLLASPMIFLFLNLSLLQILSVKIICVGLISFILSILISMIFRKTCGDFSLEADIFYFDLPAYLIDKLVKPLINLSHRLMQLLLNFIRPQKDIIVGLNVGSSVSVKLLVNFMIILLAICYFA